MSHPERLITLPGTLTTLRVVRAERPRHTVVFFHGLLGDGHQWDVFNYHTPPHAWADCLYLDFHFEAKRPSSLKFGDMLRDTTLLLRAASGQFGLVHDAVEGDEPVVFDRRLPVAFVGSSFGGHLALHLASRGPVRPDNLVLFAAGGIPEAAKQRGLLKSYRTVDKIFEVSFDRIFSEPSVAGNAEIRDLLRTYKERIEPHRRVFIRNLLDLSRSMMDNSLAHDELRRLYTRTLLVWGKRDIVTPPEIGSVFAALLPNARTLWVEAGHASHVERADVGSRALRSFCLNEDEYADDARVATLSAAMAG